MNDGKKALLTAGMLTAFYVLLLWTTVGPIIRPHMKYFVSGPLVFLHGTTTTMTGFMLLVGGIFVVFFVPSLALWRAVYLRRTGLMLQRAHGDVRRGMPGMEALSGRMK